MSIWPSRFRSETRTLLAAALLALSCRTAEARLYAPANTGPLSRSAAVLDEQNRRSGLLDLLRGPGPAIILPIFTKCPAVCPVMAADLKAALEKSRRTAPFRVVVLSFDASDTSEDLKGFSSAQALPAGWEVVRAADAGAVRQFLDQFGYVFMQADEGFVHPTEAFVISGRGRWSGTLVGSDYSPEDLKAAYKAAERLDRPEFFSRLGPALAGPLVLAALACAAIALARRAAVSAAGRKSPKPERPAPPSSAA